MTLREAQIICNEIDSKFAGKTAWTDIYADEDAILQDLAKVYIPKNRTAPNCTFIGYGYIYSFAYYVQHGYKLSAKQMTQAKRNAVNIRKASAISEYRF